MLNEISSNIKRAKNLRTEFCKHLAVVENVNGGSTDGSVPPDVGKNKFCHQNNESC